MATEIEPLERKETEAILETMRQRLAKEFGVTLVEDSNGAWGKAGTRYLTLRFNNFEVQMEVSSVSDNNLNRLVAWERENPK